MRLLELGRDDIHFDPQTDERTEKELQDQVNALRLWDAGKVKWVKYNN